MRPKVLPAHCRCLTKGREEPPISGNVYFLIFYPFQVKLNNLYCVDTAMLVWQSVYPNLKMNTYQNPNTNLTTNTKPIHKPKPNPYLDTNSNPVLYENPGRDRWS